jgi:hypothetical protein
MKIFFRGDAPIAQMTFSQMLPDGLKDVVCIQTTHDHIRKISGILAMAMSEGPDSEKANKPFRRSDSRVKAKREGKP